MTVTLNVDTKVIGEEKGWVTRDAERFYTTVRDPVSGEEYTVSDQDLADKLWIPAWVLRALREARIFRE